MTTYPLLHWDEAGENRCARWRSEAGVAPARRTVVVDDTLTADVAYRLANEGTAMLWGGDFQNARQLLNAMARRAEQKSAKARRPAKVAIHNELAAHKPVSDVFNQHRLAQAQRARVLGMLLIPLDADYAIPLRRAPDLRVACAEAYGAGDVPSVASLRELLGIVGAHEWRKKGVAVAALGGRVHPHYGVFAPVRGEYVGLVAEAPLPAAVQINSLAFDIGTGTGVLAAILAKRGIARVVATDQDARALACARENVSRLGVAAQVDVVEADLFPPGRAPLIVCNPPWIPARPSAPIEYAIYDPDSRMLRGFIAGLAAHLVPGGEAWLVLSDIAEHLGLRTRDELLAIFATGGVKVIGREDIRPQHPRAADTNDALHTARAAEVTSLWRLALV